MYTQRPSLLTSDADPLDVLCSHYNVARPILPPHLQSGAELPPTIDVSLLRSSPSNTTPTHVLFVTPSINSYARSTPLLLPVDLALTASRLLIDLPFPLAAQSTTLSGAAPHILTLPLIHFPAPHPATLALLFLFATHPTSSPLLANLLLPPTVVTEFPNSSAMANVLARTSGLARVSERSEGLWRNVLGLGVREADVQKTASMVWNVVKEARRLRERMAESYASRG